MFDVRFAIFDVNTTSYRGDLCLVRFMKRVIVAATLAVTLLPLRVRPQGKASANPPEMKKTVDAFAGHWVITGTDVEPDAKAPVKFELTLDCKRTALGAAVACAFAGNMPNVGPIEAAAVIGYSPDEQVVRWMEISSTGEYHDHRGRWNGAEIEFEPLEYSVSGKKATEYLHIGFPVVGKLTLSSVTETPEGKSVLECTGMRVEPKPK
jgi:hypothetical protein